MSRNFNGTNERITFGADASIGGFTAHSMSLWIRLAATGSNRALLVKDRITAQWGFGISSGDRLQYHRDWSTTDGIWEITTPTITTALTHVAVIYDGGSVANDPVVYINGASVTVTETSTPTLTLNSDSASNLLAGEQGNGTRDFSGDMGWLCYYSGLWTADQINRAKWWGWPGGAIAFYHPLETDSLTNKGTGTANGTATGTTMSSIPRVERRWGSMMGVGR